MFLLILQNLICAFLAYKKQSRNLRYFLHFCSDKGFKGTVVNRALLSLHEGSLEITLTVPLTIAQNHDKTIVYRYKQILPL